MYRNLGHSKNGFIVMQPKQKSRKNNHPSTCIASKMKFFKSKTYFNE